MSKILHLNQSPLQLQLQPQPQPQSTEIIFNHLKSSRSMLERAVHAALLLSV
jgi:hypothetical protein